MSSETGVLTDVLLCPPDHYRWLDINAIAHRTLAAGAPFDAAGAARQFAGLADLLRREGARPHFLTPEPHLPHQVHVRDSSQTTPWGPVLTQLRRPQRRGEYAGVIEFHGRDFWKYATAGTCEGGDIHILRPGLLLIGHSGASTDLDGARQLAGWFEDLGWQVRLQPFAEHFPHLDVLFCMATDSLAVCCLEALGPAFAEWLAQFGIEVIEARYAEATAMSCNLLSLGGGRVISAAHAGRINAELRERGVEVFDPPLDLFALGGGGVHAMTMPLKRERLY